ncbi:VOC family protein [Rathayibacter sp. VKM Ac-2929]|uniref:VOC family protein n=1 Tax=Rathayibacter sp. VKM Ac-2929 TaxID=2929480 RepID=UPI001FB3D1BC|nr:VOC family protein [Rathayibacter sp. VKM Ac-2929]MCJ1673753.1 VOC family protein [Rathayibacter sp. VKM Ac-2929]
MALHLRQIVLDAENARELAASYLALLDGEYRPGDEPAADGSDDDAEWVAIRTSEGVGITVQRVDELPRVTWPDGPVRQQLHLDFTVTDAEELERQRARAVALGATVIDDQSADPEEALYVLADPAGHPFCIFVADDGTAQPSSP